MRQKITVTLFLLLIGVFSFVVLVLPKDETAAVKENRTLAELPEFSFDALFRGEFTRDFETYLSDNVGYRSFFTDISSYYEDSKGVKKYGKLVDATGDLGVGTTTKSQLLVMEDRVMEVYQRNPEVQKKYLEFLNFYADKMQENINMYCMLIPTQIDFIPHLKGLGDSERENIEYFYDFMDIRYQPIDIYDTLKAHQDEYIYFRTDHHWTTLGAYYAYNKLAEVMEVPQADINNFQEGKQENFLGHLYAQAKTPSLKQYADTIYYYKNEQNDLPMTPVTYSYHPGERLEYDGKIFCPEEGPKYELFLAGDHPFIEINTHCKNNRTLLLLKDSYSNAMIPWLACGFQQILVIDPRTFDQKVVDILAQYPVTDMLITNYIMGTNFIDYIELCKNIFE